MDLSGFTDATEDLFQLGILEFVKMFFRVEMSLQIVGQRERFVAKVAAIRRLAELTRDPEKKIVK